MTFLARGLTVLLLQKKKIEFNILAGRLSSFIPFRMRALTLYYKVGSIYNDDDSGSHAD